jgi:hypothetical protein
MTAVRNVPGKRASLLALAALTIFGMWGIAAVMAAQPLSREQDIIELRLGQRVKVDDGACPAGQIKEVSGTKMTETGVTRARKCVPRAGPKQK